jgi:hypothetical protein
LSVLVSAWLIAAFYRALSVYNDSSAVLDPINDPSLGFGGAWGGMLAFDALVFILTVYKTFTIRWTSGSNLLTLLLRDGESHARHVC